MVVCCPKCGAVQQLKEEPDAGATTLVFACISCREQVEMPVSMAGGGTLASRQSVPEKSGPVDTVLSYQAPDQDNPDILAGKIVDGYRFDELIGSGPWALTYSGEQLALRRAVAIKVLRQSYVTDADRIYAFLEGARDSARLLHPHIVPVYDVVSAGDLHFVVLEQQSGCPLEDQVVKEGPLPFEEVVYLGLAAADALTYTHSQHLYHGDLHPGNVFVGKRPVYRLADCCRLVMLEPTIPESVPKQKRLVYLAPELLRCEEPRPMADIFSLGGTLFWALTGLPPYRVVDLEEMQAGGESLIVPDPISINPEIPESFSRMLRAMLEPNPADRPQSMDEITTRLSELAEEFRQVAELEASGESKRRIGELGPSNRRRYRRLRSDMDVEIAPCEAQNKSASTIMSQVQNLSENGAFIASEAPLPIGTVVNLEFDLAIKNTRVKVLGVVRWISSDKEDPGMGVQFMEVATTDRKSLREYVDDRMMQEMGKTLTRTATHRTILQEVTTHWGRVVSFETLIERCGASQALLKEILPEFERFGLIRVLHRSIKCTKPASRKVSLMLKGLVLKG